MDADSMVSPFPRPLAREPQGTGGKSLVPVSVQVPAIHAAKNTIRLCSLSRAMLFRQVIHEDLGCASYLVGDTASGVAAVVDPRWDIDPYLHLARLHGVRVEHVLETHNHADHVS